MNKLLYYIIFSWGYLHALLPMKILYILSDIFYFFVYKLVGYRLKVVRQNLANSFPEKSAEERLKTEKEFYHHFCDYFMETLKLLHISAFEMQKHMRFENVELLKKLMAEHGSVFMSLGHYGNWEWISSISLHLEKEESLAYIYRPLRNKAFDDLFLKMRGGFASISIPKNNTLRAILRMRQQKERVLIGFLSDQTPTLNNIHYWTNFLNQDTPVFTGLERIAKQTGFPIIYLDIQKEKRGYYKVVIKLITDNPKDEPEFAITERYMSEVEKSILRKPAYWLWTHKRWKVSRKEMDSTK